MKAVLFIVATLFGVPAHLLVLKLPAMRSNASCLDYEDYGARKKIEMLLLCGHGDWRELINLDMRNLSHSCPLPWTVVNTSTRLCSSSYCQSSITLPVSSNYTKVCGKVIGYARLSPDAFDSYSKSIDSIYLDGVSITHGRYPRKHIWSLAAGHDDSYFTGFRCPCENSDRNYTPLPPAFVGENTTFALLLH